MDDNARNALLEQLADSSERMASAVETLSGEMSANRQRMQNIEAELREMLKSQLDAAERSERLALRVEDLDKSSPHTQLEALRSAHTKTESQINVLQEEIQRLETLKKSMTEMRREVVNQIDERERALRVDLDTMGRQRIKESEQFSREYQGLRSRLDLVEDWGDTLEAVERRVDEQIRVVQDLEQVDESLRQEMGRREEASRQREERMAQQNRDLGAVIQGMKELVNTWQGRIEAQDKNLAQSQGIARDMQLEAVKLREEQHAAGEAQRLHEGRVENLITNMQTSVDARFEQLASLREEDWSKRERVIRDADASIVESVDLLRSQLQDAQVRLEETIQAGVAVNQKDIEELGRRLSIFLRLLRDATAEGSDAFEPSLPSDDPATVGPERRQALRRALRARRAAQDR